MRKSQNCRALLAVALACPALASAASYTWIGGTNGTWTNTANWAGGSIPAGTQDDIVHFATSPNYATPPSNFTCNQIIMDNGVSQTYNGGPVILTADSVGNAPKVIGANGSIWKTALTLNTTATFAGSTAGAIMTADRPIGGSAGIDINDGTIAAVVSLAGANTFGDATHGVRVRSGTFRIGNNSAAGVGPITMENNSSISVVYGFTATAANNLVLKGNINVALGAAGASTGLTINGTTDLSGANRLITGNIDGTNRVFKLAGKVSNGGLELEGPYAATNLGGSNIPRFIISGTGNDYAGGTQIDHWAWVRVDAGSSLGTGDVTIQSVSGYTGRLQLDTNTAIADTATLSIASITAAPVFLNFTGNEVVGSLVLNGVTQAPGVYSATSDPGVFSGTGAIQVVPEPVALTLLAMGGLGLLRRRRR